jgi:hypothetical protein
MNDPIYDGVGSRNPMLPEPEFLPCGHHKSLLLKSAETGLPLYCDLCDARSAQRDAEEMEAKYAAQVEALEAEVARLKAVETLLTPQGGYQPQSQGDNPANAPPDAE